MIIKHTRHMMSNGTTSNFLLSFIFLLPEHAEIVIENIIFK